MRLVEDQHRARPERRKEFAEPADVHLVGQELGREKGQEVVCCLDFPDLRTDVQRVQLPAKTANGRLSSKADQSGGREP